MKRFFLVLIMLLLVACQSVYMVYDGTTSSEKIHLSFTDDSLDKILDTLTKTYPELKVINKKENALFLETPNVLITVTENDLNEEGRYCIEYDRR